MVNHVTALGRNGVHDYLLLRASAIVLTCYVLYLIGFIAFNEITYDHWHGFFAALSTKAFTMLALLAMVVHAWIGLWQVLTDYVKPIALRVGCQFILSLLALFYLATGVVILWGV